MTRARRATSVHPAPAVRRSAGSTATTPSSARATSCIATHPSDMAVAMVALDAQIELLGASGSTRTVAHRRFPSPAGRHAAHRDRARAGRDDHRRRRCLRRRRAGSSTARFATARPTSSRWSPSPPSSRRSRHDHVGAQSRSAASRTSRGVRSKRRQRWSGRPATMATYQRRRGCRDDRRGRAAATTTSRSSSRKRTLVARSRKQRRRLRHGAIIGQPINRVDGPLKVSGHATYAYEHWDVGQPLYGFIVGATIGKGRITRIDTSRAEQAPGVRMVMTHRNAPAQGKPDLSTSSLYSRALSRSRPAPTSATTASPSRSSSRRPSSRRARRRLSSMSRTPSSRGASTSPRGRTRPTRRRT